MHRVELSVGSEMNSEDELIEKEGGGGWSAEGAFEDQVWLRAVYGIIAVLGIIGNFLVMFTVARVPSLQNLTNMFIVSLAVSDFIVSVFLIPLHLGEYVTKQNIFRINVTNTIVF